MECEVESVKYGVESVKCEVRKCASVEWSGNCEVQIVECRVRSVKWRV